jgi:ubiquinone/menaquinone biosynthesis C-methylase UbiE
MILFAQQFSPHKQTIREDRAVQHYYDTFAPFYDSFYEPVDYDAWAALIQKQIDATVPPQRKILDLGCGTGSILHRLANHPTQSCFGVDLSRQMLLQARDKLKIASVKQRLFHSNLFALGFQSNTFDVAIGAFGLLNLYSDSARRLLLAEIWRVLRPQSIFVSDFSTLNRYRQLQKEISSDAETHHEEPAFKIKNILLTKTHALEKKLTVQDRTVSKQLHFLDPDQVAADLKATRFEVIAMTSLVQGVDLQKANRLMIVSRKP